MKRSQLINATICLMLLLMATSAAAVTSAKRSQPVDQDLDWVTTGVAARAHSDVQMRRLLNLFAAKKLDSNDLYDRLQELRKQSRN